MAERVLWSAEALNYAIGTQTLFKDAAFSIRDGERVALIGRNGSGKSTLLRIIDGLDSPSGGNITVMRNCVISFMPQSAAPESAGRTVGETLREGLARFEEIHRRCDALPPESGEHAELEQYLTVHDAWDPELKLRSLASRMDLPPMEKTCGLLSGGELRRVMLARAILSEPDLLLLDEPTNHLDAETVGRIEDFLAGYRGACLFVTHDRFFLDRIATRIVELDHGSFFSCEGSYADFLAAKEAREYDEDRAESKRNAFLRREIEWVRRAPKARLRRNLGRIKRYEETAAVRAPERLGSMELVIPAADHLGNKVVTLKNIGESKGGKTLLRDFSFEFHAGQRVGIVGSNGAGKTTLLRIITGQLKPDSGTVETAPTVEFNYIDQSRVRLNPENTVREEVAPEGDTVQFGGETIGVYGYLKRFLFEDDRINTQVKLLSGGEKARLALAKILRGRGNFILLDEPANDLDIPTLRVLEESLASYTGCLAVVSHDRYFLNRVCTHIIALEGDGNVFAGEGDWDYYEEKHRERSRMAELSAASSRKIEKTPPAPRTPKKNPEKLSYRETRELEALEPVIAEKEKRTAEIEHLYSDPDFYAKHGGDAAALQKELDTLKSELETHYSRWEELESKKESSGK